MNAVAPLERTIDLPSMVAYAAATWDHHRMHYDPEWAASHGLPAPVVDGQALGALLAEQVLDHFGPRAFVKVLDIRYRSMVFAGETVTCTGEIAAVDGDEVTVRQEARVGDRVAATAEARVRT